MKYNLGCGNNLEKGYINVDKFDREADVIADMCEMTFEPDSVDEFTIYQTLEHIPWNKTDKLIEKLYDALIPGGKLIIEVPDIGLVAEYILRDGITQQWHDNLHGGYFRPQDVERYPDWEFHLGSIHYQSFDKKRMKSVLENAGFEQIRFRTMDEKHPNYKYEENLSVEAIK